MKKLILPVLFMLASFPNLFGQIVLTKQGLVINSTDTGTWIGDNIPRIEPTLFTYRNNSITSVNKQGYMLQAGDEAPSPSNNNLDGQLVSGNKFTWNGFNSNDVITHGLFVGYNINSRIEYNYLDKAPYGIIFKSGTEDGVNMTFTSGGAAYNICKNGKFALRIKGINGVHVYNNTFYNDNGTGWYFLLITANTDRLVQSPSTGSKIFNNIFYSTKVFPMIQIESGCFNGFECDYNVYWCTAGEPIFNIDGVVTTWAQWRALGYDAHSIIADPRFINTSDLVPSIRLDYGKNLGTEWQAGLSNTAVWKVGASPTTINQIGTWQVGARIYPAPVLISSILVSGATTITTDKGTLQLTAALLPLNATNQSVTWSIVNGTGNATISSTGLVTAVENGTVTAQATANDGSGIFGTLNILISNQVSLPTGLNNSVKKNESVAITIGSTDLKIMSTHDFITGKAILYNLQGVLIKGKTIENDTIIFDISAIPSGIYFVELSKGRDKRIIKVLKP